MHTGVKVGLVLLAASAAAFVALRPNKADVPILGKSITNLAWTACDGLGTPYFTVSNVQISGTLTVGSTTTTTITGTVTKAFTLASTDTTIKLGLIQVFTGVSPVTPNENYAVGPLNMVSKTQVNQDPPTGSYTSTVRFLDPANKKLQCLQLTYKIV